MREVFLLDFKTVIDIISKSNINNEKVYELVKEASSLDLKDEDNIRLIIRKGCELANKSISLDQEDRIVQILKEKGITADLFMLLK